ncbi:MAG: hypothetical protein HY815_14295 [Candidatus Riflebacteria bacterium]|nr:hypothetical protein [Candidatus Riflebacteria bacterium]
MRVQSILFGLLLVVLLAVHVQAEALPLAYRFPAGSTFQEALVSHASPPMGGPLDTNMKTRSTVKSADGAGMRLEHDVTMTQTGASTIHVTLQCHVSPEGQVTDVTGVDWNDPDQALVARNVAAGYSKLPNAVVQVGATWEEEKPFYLPKSSVPGVPSMVRVRSTYTVTALTDGPVPTATLAIKSKESPGQSAKIDATGTLVLDAATGRTVKSHVDGTLTVKVVFSQVKVPFTADITPY